MNSNNPRYLILLVMLSIVIVYCDKLSDWILVFHLGSFSETTLHKMPFLLQKRGTFLRYLTYRRD